MSISLQPNRPTTPALAWIEAHDIHNTFDSANNDDIYALEPIEQVENVAPFLPLFVCAFGVFRGITHISATTWTYNASLGLD